jgi:hypothetical protein
MLPLSSQKNLELRGGERYVPARGMRCRWTSRQEVGQVKSSQVGQIWREAAELRPVRKYPTASLFQ